MNSEHTPPPIARRLDVAAITAWTRRNELVIRAYRGRRRYVEEKWPSP